LFTKPQTAQSLGALLATPNTNKFVQPSVSLNRS
jgi:hypothetical protein